MTRKFTVLSIVDCRINKEQIDRRRSDKIGKDNLKYKCNVFWLSIDVGARNGFGQNLTTVFIYLCSERDLLHVWTVGLHYFP